MHFIAINVRSGKTSFLVRTGTIHKEGYTYLADQLETTTTD